MRSESALFNYLSTKLQQGTKKLRLFSGNCPGQNKNYVLVALLSAFSTRTKITVENFFPIRGHSYMPADRAFGRVERRSRKIERILLPSEYFEEFRVVEEVREYIKHWAIYNLKAFARDVLKSKQTFLISN